MLKRGLSVFLATVLMILCFFSVPVFAAEPEFDISDYTIEDLKTMTTAEKKKLMEDFVEAYNPYGLRDLMEQEASASGGFGVQPLWKSDSDLIEKDQQIATHQLITLEALSTYIAAFGLPNADGTTAMFVALYLSAASGLPDVDETEWGFAGHFYSADIGYGINVFYKSAKDNVAEHYATAYQNLRANPHVDLNSNEFIVALEYLGRALHYIQDVCEPHHAANLIAGVSTHLSFETYVDGLIDMFLPQNVTVSNNRYLEARTKTAAELAHNAAIDGSSQVHRILQTSPQTEWDEAARISLRYAVENSAVLIYKLFADCGLV